ncbi:MAG TPA: alpha/beta fold hydrolase [Aldersonia sp.]
MADLNRLEPFSLPLTVRGIDVGLAGMRRGGTGTPIVFLHGFGSTKEDYADIVHQAALDDRPIFAYDAPGCGATTCADLSAVTIPFLVDVAIAALDASGIDRCDLVGHSMGALTALLLADRHPDRVNSFVNIEGNLAPEDCFLSRQALEHPTTDPDAFLRTCWESLKRLLRLPPKACDPVTARAGGPSVRSSPI